MGEKHHTPRLWRNVNVGLEIHGISVVISGYA